MENDEKVESSAEIISDIRERADTAERHGEHQTRNDGVAMLLRSIADRLEAALKREHSQSWHHREMEELILRHEKEVAELKRERDLAIYAYDPTKAAKSLAPDGSAYALEALEHQPVGNAAAMREALMRIKHLFRDINLCEDTIGNEAFAIADAALTAPPRNCDRFDTATQARHAFNEWLKSHRLCPISFGGWLMAESEDKDEQK